MARHHELQAELRRLPARSHLVEPDDKGQGRPGRHPGCGQLAGDTRAGGARVEIPLARRPEAGAKAPPTSVSGSMQTTSGERTMHGLGGAPLVWELWRAGSHG